MIQSLIYINFVVGIILTALELIAWYRKGQACLTQSLKTDLCLSMGCFFILPVVFDRTQDIMLARANMEQMMPAMLRSIINGGDLMYCILAIFMGLYLAIYLCYVIFHSDKRSKTLQSTETEYVQFSNKNF